MALAGSNETKGTDSWWSRPAGVREVLVVAMPLVVSSVSWTVMTFVDRMFLNQVAGTSMSAAFSAAVVWFAVFCLPLGICSYTNTFVSQYHGDRQPEQIGPAMWQGVWAALMSVPLAVACVPLASLIFSLAKHDAETTAKEILYFQILCAGGPGMLIAVSFSSLYSGRGKTWVVMLVDAAVTIVNLVLDYLWIFGHAGFPAAGIAGAAWATVISLWLKVIIYFILVMRQHHRREFNTWGGLRFNRTLFGRLIYFGGPSGLQMLLDVMGFTVFIVLMGRLGTMEAEATTLAFTISTVAFMPIWGFGMASSILVGQHLGENRDDLAARATWTSYRIAIGYMALVSTLYVLTPDLFLFPFFQEGELSSPRQIELHTMAVTLMRFVAAYNLLDATLMIFVSAIKGAGDTRFVLHVSMVMAVLFIGLSWLTIEELKLSIYGCWAVVTGWICLMGLAFLWRFLQGNWRTMRVIEMHHIAG